MIKKDILFKYIWKSGSVLLCIGFIGTAFKENIIFAIFGVLGLSMLQIGLCSKNKNERFKENKSERLS